MGAVQRLRTRVYATFTVFVILLTWNYVFQDRQWSRGVLLSTMLFALILPPALQAVMRKFLIARGAWGLPVIILGAGVTGALVAEKLRQECDLGFVPLGILDDDPLKWGKTIQGVPVLGSLSAVQAFENRAKVALIAMPSLNRSRLMDIVQSLSFPNVIFVPDLFGIQSLWITSRDLGGVLGLEVKKNLLIPANRLLKRMLDLLIAVPSGILAAPLVAIFATSIKIVNRGPAFFYQQREGQGGKRITVFKLRTMY